jgi:hypothetical protein
MVQRSRDRRLMNKLTIGWKITDSDRRAAALDPRQLSLPLDLKDEPEESDKPIPARKTNEDEQSDCLLKHVSANLKSWRSWNIALVNVVLVVIVAPHWAAACNALARTEKMPNTSKYGNFSFDIWFLSFRINICARLGCRLRAGAGPCAPLSVSSLPWDRNLGELPQCPDEKPGGCHFYPGSAEVYTRTLGCQES